MEHRARNRLTALGRSNSLVHPRGGARSRPPLPPACTKAEPSGQTDSGLSALLLWISSPREQQPAAGPQVDLARSSSLSLGFPACETCLVVSGVLSSGGGRFAELQAESGLTVGVEVRDSSCLWSCRRALASVTCALVRVGARSRCLRRRVDTGIGCGRPSRGRRACAELGGRRGGEWGCADRSRSRFRLGKCDRAGGWVGQLVGEVLRSDETEAERALQAGDRFGRVTAFGASGDVRGRGGGEAQPAAWAAEAGQGHGGLFLGGAFSHAGQTRFITGFSERSSSSSKYTRWRPSPDTRRMGPHSGQVYVGLGSGSLVGVSRSGGAIRVALAIWLPPRCRRCRPRCWRCRPHAAALV